MGGFIALYVTACLNLANPGSCVTEFITDSTQNQMTMTECLGVVGLNSAKEFVEKHPPLPYLAVQGLELPDGQQTGLAKGAGMNLSVARMDQHKGRSIQFWKRSRVEDGYHAP
jgi:hypothetical protein